MNEYSFKEATSEELIFFKENIQNSRDQNVLKYVEIPLQLK